MTDLDLLKTIKRAATTHFGLILACLALGATALLTHLYINSSESSAIVALAICLLAIGLASYFGYFLYATLPGSHRSYGIWSSLAAGNSSSNPAFDSGIFLEPIFKMGQEFNDRQSVIDSLPNMNRHGSEEHMIFGQVRKFKSRKAKKQRAASHNLDDFCKEPINAFADPVLNNPVREFECKVNEMSVFTDSARQNFNLIMQRLRTNDNPSASRDLQIVELLVETLSSHLHYVKDTMYSGRELSASSIENLNTIKVAPQLSQMAGISSHVEMQDFAKILEKALHRAKTQIPLSA